jgi:hypothetical protein
MDTYRTSLGFGHHTILATIARNVMFEKAESSNDSPWGHREPIDKRTAAEIPGTPSKQWKLSDSYLVAFRKRITFRYFLVTHA